MKIQIEWRDIAWGLHGNVYQCALALAIRRAVPDTSVVRVGGRTALVGTREVELPQSAREFISEFDGMVPKNLDVRPCTVDLDLEDIRVQA